MTEHDPVASERRGMGGLLGQPESGRRAGERHRHPGLLSDQGALPPQGQVPRRPRLFRRMLRRRQEARHPRDRAHEPRPELGRRRPGAPRVVPARRPGQRHAPHRGPAPVPHLHVHHLHDRLHAGHHARNQFALRRGRPLHQRLAAPGNPAGVLLRAVPPTAARRARLAYWDKFNERIVYLWKLYDSIAKEKKPVELLFRQPRRRHPFRPPT